MKYIQDFFNHNYAISRQDLSSLLSLIAPCIKSGHPEAADLILSLGRLEVKCAGPNLCDWWDIDAEDLPANSVAVLRLRGFLLASETDMLIECIHQAEANQNIVGIVLDFDGPGGHATRVDLASAAIRNCSKPVATYIAGNALSGHYWIGSAGHRVFIGSPLGQVGSVGAFTTYLNDRKYFIKQGIDIRDIYPESSDLKNEAFRAVEESDDESLIKAELSRLHEYFAKDVAQNRSIEYDPENPFFRGRCYFGDEAVAAGYVDQIGTLDQAINWVLTQSTVNQVRKLYN